MAVHKAVVRGGFLEMKEPTQLPEGTVVPLYEAEDPYAHLDDADELDDEERQRLHNSIRTGLDEINAGKGIPAEDIIKELETL